MQSIYASNTVSVCPQVMGLYYKKNPAFHFSQLLFQPVTDCSQGHVTACFNIPNKPNVVYISAMFRLSVFVVLLYIEH